jgi:chromosome segregation ATPase
MVTWQGRIALVGFWRLRVVQLGSTHRDEVVNHSCFQPQVDGETCDVSLTLAPADYQVLLEELKQAQTLDRERVDRIEQLEQALDQALAWLDELRSQLNDQALLETQLAATEDYSHVQQKAIARLKLQLSDQQQILDVQLLETQQRDQAIQELMATIETMTHTQQQELERLRSFITQDQVEVQTHRSLLAQQIQDLQTTLETRQQRIADLESETLSARTLAATLREQLATAQQQIKDLSVRLQHYQADWAQLESQLAEVQSDRQTAAKLQSAVSLPLNLPLQRMAAAESANVLASLQQDLTRTHRRIEMLENQLAQQIRLHAHWQQSHQQLEEERDRLQTRAGTLEQQAAEMQEQILHQAQQATEYETAVQYWKDRYQAQQRQLSHLHELAEQVSSELDPEGMPPALSDLLHSLLSLAADAEEALPPPSIPLPKFPTPELPDFLVRRRDRVKGQRLGLRG